MIRDPQTGMRRDPYSCARKLQPEHRKRLMLEVAQCPEVRIPVRKKAARELAELGSLKDAAGLLDKLGEKKEAADLYSRFDPKQAALILVAIGETERAYSLAADLGLGAKIEIYEVAKNLTGLGIGAVGKEKETAIEITRRLFSEDGNWKISKNPYKEAFALLTSIVAVGWKDEAKQMMDEVAESYLKTIVRQGEKYVLPTYYFSLVFAASRIAGDSDIALKFYRKIRKRHWGMLLKIKEDGIRIDNYRKGTSVDNYQVGVQLRLAQLLFNLGNRDEALKVMPPVKEMKKLLAVHAEAYVMERYGYYEWFRTTESPYTAYHDIEPLNYSDNYGDRKPIVDIPEYQEKLWLIPLRIYWESGLYEKFKEQLDILQKLANKVESRKNTCDAWFWTKLAEDKVLNILARKDASLRSELERFIFPVPFDKKWDHIKKEDVITPNPESRPKWDFLRPEAEIQEREARKNRPKTLSDIFGCSFG